MHAGKFKVGKDYDLISGNPLKIPRASVAWDTSSCPMHFLLCLLSNSCIGCWPKKGWGKLMQTQLERCCLCNKMQEYHLQNFFWKKCDFLWDMEWNLTQAVSSREDGILHRRLNGLKGGWGRSDAARGGLYAAIYKVLTEQNLKTSAKRQTYCYHHQKY